MKSSKNLIKAPPITIFDLISDFVNQKLLNKIMDNVIIQLMWSVSLATPKPIFKVKSIVVQNKQERSNCPKNLIVLKDQKPNMA